MTGVQGPGKRQTGTTLAEMVIVVAVIAIAAALALPRSDPQAGLAADAVAGEIARAIRFAQREAIRTGTYQLVSVNPATQVLKVYRTTDKGDVLATHPVDKRDYEISFANNAMPRATIVSSVFKYEDGANTNFTAFGPDGNPVDPTPDKLLTQLIGMLLGAKDAPPLKEEGKITIRYGNAERVVRVTPVTGRVAF
jgi:Tfp pilus assembly protein FimT